MELLWLPLVAGYIYVGVLLRRDMARLGRGGRKGWRYAVLFWLLPLAGLGAWFIDHRRFERSPTR